VTSFAVMSFAVMNFVTSVARVVTSGAGASSPASSSERVTQF
jgi:hypothetical protein